MKIYQKNPKTIIEWMFIMRKISRTQEHQSFLCPGRHLQYPHIQGLVLLPLREGGVGPHPTFIWDPKGVLLQDKGEPYLNLHPSLQSHIGLQRSYFGHKQNRRRKKRNISVKWPQTSHLTDLPQRTNMYGRPESLPFIMCLKPEVLYGTQKQQRQSLSM